MDKFTLIETDGDLFSVDPSYSMAHCVGADMKLGKGIAIKFRNKFGRIPELKAQNATSGGVAILKDQQRYIYYLVTKENSWNKPTYQTLYCSLHVMRQHMLKHHVAKLAIPRIACGLDGLEWPKVKNLIEETFTEDPIEIAVYNYIPKKFAK